MLRLFCKYGLESCAKIFRLRVGCNKIDHLDLWQYLVFSLFFMVYLGLCFLFVFCLLRGVGRGVWGFGGGDGLEKHLVVLHVRFNSRFVCCIEFQNLDIFSSSCYAS